MCVNSELANRAIPNQRQGEAHSGASDILPDGPAPASDQPARSQQDVRNFPAYGEKIRKPATGGPPPSDDPAPLHPHRPGPAVGSTH